MLRLHNTVKKIINIKEKMSYESLVTVRKMYWKSGLGKTGLTKKQFEKIK